MAAHLKSPAVVGHAAAAVAALTLLATIAQLNLTHVFVRWLPSAGRLGRRLISQGYVAVVGLALVLGTAYVISPLSAHVVTGGWLAHMLFVAAVAILAIFALEDAVLTALRLMPWVAAENVSAAACRVGLLAVLVLLPEGGGFVVSWVLPAAVAVVVVNLLLFWRVLPRLLSFVAAEYTGSICSTATAQLTPLLVLWRLGPAHVAYFTVPWLILGAITALLWNVSFSFVVEVASNPERARALLRRGISLSAAIVLGVLLFCVVGASPLLRLAGAGYAAHGAALLRLIGCSAPFTAVVVTYEMLIWLDQRVWLLALIQGVTGLAIIGTTVLLLPQLGLLAAGWATLGVQAVAAVAMAPLAIQRIRRGELTTPHQARQRAVRTPGRRRARPRLRTGTKRTELTAYIGVFGSLAAVVLVIGAPWPSLRLVGALMLACVPAGAGVMCWFDSGEVTAQAGLTLAVSLSVVALLSALMIWTASWHPHVLLALADVSAVSCVARLWVSAA